MIKPVVQGGIRISTIEVAGGCRNSGERKRDTDGQTKSLPLAVVLAVPFALFGALVAIWLRDLNNDVYFQIGLVTLIGLASKNAILIVEFAVLKRREGLSAMEAAAEAAKLRFRPIIMTSLAFILGCVPLAISTGAGAASRHSIGTGVIGGMLAATFIAMFFIPLFYRLVSKRASKKPV